MINTVMYQLIMINSMVDVGANHSVDPGRQQLRHMHTERPRPEEDCVCRQLARYDDGSRSRAHHERAFRLGRLCRHRYRQAQVSDWLGTRDVRASAEFHAGCASGFCRHQLVQVC